MRKYSVITVFGIFAVLIAALIISTPVVFAQQSGDSDRPLHATHHNNQSNSNTAMPMTGTVPVGDMSQMMPMMMQMMGQMHGMMDSMPLTDTKHIMDYMMPMTGTVHMDDMSQMMPMMMPILGYNMAITETMFMTGTLPMMTQMMGYRMQTMGLHMQMMGLHLQMMGQMYSATSNAIPMMGTVHSQQQKKMMSGAMTERQAMVAEAGRAVMPFDLDATTHIFEKNEQGGLQQVIADDPNDTTAIEQIRAHLAEEAARFAEGDFHDPQMIHGAAMPGLHELMMSADRIVIDYSELPNGAQILYTTDDADLVAAIHSWFDAQVADHGPHAIEQR